MILKAGTYRFNDDMNLDSFTEYCYYPINFYFVISSNEIDFQFNCTQMSMFGSSTPKIISYTVESTNPEGALSPLPKALGVWTDGVWNEFVAGLSIPDTITITQDTEVDDTFGTWYIANTNYNEVNAKPLAEITYNGETIAHLNAGETAVLKCAGLPMVADITVKVNG